MTVEELYGLMVKTGSELVALVPSDQQDLAVSLLTESNRLAAEMAVTLLHAGMDEVERAHEWLGREYQARR